MSITVTSNFDPKAEAKTVETKEDPVKAAEVKETKEAGAVAAAAEGEEQSTETLEASEPREEEESGSEVGEELEGKPEKPQKKSGFQKKVDKLRAQREAAKQEADYWREQALKSQKPAEAKPADEKPVLKGEPDPKDFESHIDYVKAVTRWEVSQERAKDVEASQKAQIDEEVKELNKAHKARVDEFAKTKPDWDEAIESVEAPLSEALMVAVVQSQVGPQIIYHLAKNEAEIERLNALPKTELFREIGKLEAKFSSDTSEQKETKTKSNASKPISTVKPGSGSGKKSIYDPDISQKEYEAQRMEQIASRKSAWG